MNAELSVPIKDANPINIRPVDLGQDGLAFMQSTLSPNGPLSSSVVRLFGDKGKVFALMPEGESSERARQFRTGGMMKMGVPHRWFADYMSSHWGKNGCQLIFESPWGTPNVALHPPRQPYFFGGSIIYYAPDSRNVYNALYTGMREVSSFLLIGFVLSPPAPLPKSGETIDQARTDALVQNVQAVFVSAYDQESYVVWEK